MCLNWVIEARFLSNQCAYFLRTVFLNQQKASSGSTLVHLTYFTVFMFNTRSIVAHNLPSRWKTLVHLVGHACFFLPTTFFLFIVVIACCILGMVMQCIFERFNNTQWRNNYSFITQCCFDCLLSFVRYLQGFDCWCILQSVMIQKAER